METTFGHQLILAPDKSNPSFSLYVDEEKKSIHVYYGVELLEVVPDDFEHMAFKMMVGRLYNAKGCVDYRAVIAREVESLFEVKLCGETLRQIVQENQVGEAAMAGTFAEKEMSAEAPASGDQASGACGSGPDLDPPSASVSLESIFGSGEMACSSEELSTTTDLAINEPQEPFPQTTYDADGPAVSGQAGSKSSPPTCRPQ